MPNQSSSGGGRILAGWATILIIAAAAGAGAYLYLPGEWSPWPWPTTIHADPTAAQPARPAPPEVILARTALYEGTDEVPVLMYHDVMDRPAVYFDLSTREFRGHLEELKRAGANVVPLADLYAHLSAGKQLPERAVVLTFDDGYAGTYENAYPLLKKFGYPATFFVHTGAVGVNTGRPHMTWEQLQELDREGLVSIESHTVSHPEDLRKCGDEQLEQELNQSKAVLEEKLGRKMRFLAYPVGNADGRVAKVAREAGYEMAMTMGPGWAGSPADAFFVPRLYPRGISELCARLKQKGTGPDIRPRVVDLSASELENSEFEDGQVRMKYIRGGRLSGLRLMGRRDVPSFVQAAGAAAGLNGTFFSDARVNSAGAGIVGPIMNRFGPGFAPGLPGDRERIAGRPLVVMSPEKMAFLPFRPNLALDAEGVERLLPGATDCFIAGAWLVHRGRPLDREELESFRLSNIFDFRPRAVVGVDDQGRPFLGAASTGNESDRLAETLVKLGLQECVLLDSGFSTSLVWGREVLVSGIRRKDMPARPVPHALLLHRVNTETGEEIIEAPPSDPDAVGPRYVPTLEGLQALLSQENVSDPDPDPVPRRRGRRHRRR